MTLQQFADLGEAVAAVAVVLSLVALVVQMQQSTKTMRATAIWDAQMAFVAINETLAAGGILSEVAFKVFTSPEQLTDYERHIFHRYMRAVWQRVEAQFALYRTKILDSEVWELRRGYTKALLSNPLIAEIWQLELRNSMLTKAFVEEIDKAPAADMPSFAGGAALASAAPVSAAPSAG